MSELDDDNNPHALREQCAGNSVARVHLVWRQPKSRANLP